MKKNIFYAFVCTIFVSFMNISIVSAQEEEEDGWSMTLGADVVSKNLWRGFESADASIQPLASFDYQKGDWGLSVGSWGSKAFKSDQYNEIDIFAEASWKNFALSLTNYSEFTGSHLDTHSLDLGLKWTLSENIPLTVAWYSIINKNWDEALPSYLELSYDFSVSVIDFQAAAGAFPFSSDYYGNDKFCVSNLTLSAGHTFNLNEQMTVPVSARVMYNPDLKETYWYVSAGYFFTLDF